MSVCRRCWRQSSATIERPTAKHIPPPCPLCCFQETAKWRQQAEAWKVRLGATGELKDLKPWTSLPGLQLRGVPDTARSRCILDLVALEMLGGAREAAAHIAAKGGPRLIKQALSQTLVDLSQNPVRRSHTGVTGYTKCLHTNTILYSFKRDRVILPLEEMVMMGHSTAIQIPTDMSVRELKCLAGMGIYLPTLGAVIVSLMLSVGL